MATSVASVVSHFPEAENGFTTTTAGSVSSGAATVTLNSVAGYTNGKPVVLVIDPTDPAKKQTFTGIVDTSGVQITSVVWTAGTNQTHALGATVVDYATATHISMISKGVEVEHNQDGTHVPSLPLTTPKITTSINDANGNEVIKTPATASAVNEITVTNAATGNDPKIEATGGDTNASVRISGKGTGGVILSSGSHARAIISATDVASSVNYHLMYGSATGGSIQHAAAGTDTNISFNIASKGSGEVAVNNVAFSGAWQSYTPTFANTTLGNGTVAGNYKQIGKSVFFRAFFFLGTTSAVGTVPTVSLPVTSIATPSGITPIGIVHYYDNSSAATVEGNLRWSSTTTAGLQVSAVTAAALSYVRNDAVTATVPFTFAVNDAILITGSYEAA